MERASVARWPTLLLFFSRSLPARSTRYNLPTLTCGGHPQAPTQHQLLCCSGRLVADRHPRQCCAGCLVADTRVSAVLVAWWQTPNCSGRLVADTRLFWSPGGRHPTVLVAWWQTPLSAGRGQHWQEGSAYRLGCKCGQGDKEEKQGHRHQGWETAWALLECRVQGSGSARARTPTDTPTPPPHPHTFTLCEDTPSRSARFSACFSAGVR